MAQEKWPLAAEVIAYDPAMVNSLCEIKSLSSLSWWTVYFVRRSFSGVGLPKFVISFGSCLRFRIRFIFQFQKSYYCFGVCLISKIVFYLLALHVLGKGRLIRSQPPFNKVRPTVINKGGQALEKLRLRLDYCRKGLLVNVIIGPVRIPP